MRTTRPPTMLVTTLFAVLVAGAASAAEKRARLTINVTAQGTYSIKATTGGEYTNGKFSESYGIVTYYKASGDLEVYNTKDPTYGQKMMRRAQQAQAAVAQAQGKSPAKKISPQEYQTLMKAKQDACKGDKNCLMQAAMEASKLAANIDYGAAAGGTSAAAADDEEYDEEEDPEANFLTYSGYDNCGSSTYVKVDRSSSGAYADVQGMVPWSSSEHADYHGDALQRRMACIYTPVVLDTKKREVWGLAFGLGGAKGTDHEVDGGRVQDNANTAVTYGHGAEWVFEQLNSHQLSGSRTVTQNLTKAPYFARHGGKVTGTATITVNWKFEDVPN